MPRSGCSVHAVGAFDSAFKQTIPVATSRSRDATRPSCAFKSFALLEGVGNAGCPWHPQPRVRFALVEMHTSKRVPRNHPTFPHAMVLTVSFVLSSVTGLVATVAHGYVLSKPGWADLTPRNLTPASRRQDHTTSPYAATSFVSSPFDRSRAFRQPALHHVARLTLPRPPHPIPRL